MAKLLLVGIAGSSVYFVYVPNTYNKLITTYNISSVVTKGGRFKFLILLYLFLRLAQCHLIL